MLAKYYVAVRSQTNDHHAMHKEGCPFLPDDKMRIYLGMFNSGQDALREGQMYFTRTKSCFFCSDEHKPPEEKPKRHKLAMPVRLAVPEAHYESLVYCLN